MKKSRRWVYMRSIILPTVLLSILLLILCPMSPITAGPTQGAADPEPIPLYLNLDNGASGDLTPLSVRDDSVEEITVFGTIPPIPTLPFGRWTSNELKVPISIYGAFTCTLWAKSQDGAKNAHFIIEVFKNSDIISTFNTTDQDIGDNAIRFDVVDVLNVDLDVGDVLEVRLTFNADPIVNPLKIFPQPAQILFLFGGGLYNSGISVTTEPLVIEILEPDVQKGSDVIGFRSKVKEAFDVDPSKMNFTLFVKPPVGGTFKHIGNAVSEKTDDGIIFSADWDYVKEKKALDGMYTITMEVRYTSNQTFSNTSKFKIDVPEIPITKIEDTPINNAVIAMAALGVVIVVLAIYMNRRGSFRRGKKFSFGRRANAGARGVSKNERGAEGKKGHEGSKKVPPTKKKD